MIDTMRKVAPAAVLSALLGLPAALLAHYGIFGGDHVLGGKAHGAIFAIGLATVLAVVLLSIATAFVKRVTFALRATAWSVTLSAIVWFALIELFETPHAIPILPVLFAIAIAVWIVRSISEGIARVATVFACGFFARLKAGISAWRPALEAEPVACPADPKLFRLFSRPPPLFS